MRLLKRIFERKSETPADSAKEVMNGGKALKRIFEQKSASPADSAKEVMRGGKAFALKHPNDLWFLQNVRRLSGLSELSLGECRDDEEFGELIRAAIVEAKTKVISDFGAKRDAAIRDDISGIVTVNGQICDLRLELDECVESVSQLGDILGHLDAFSIFQPIESAPANSPKADVTVVPTVPPMGQEPQRETPKKLVTQATPRFFQKYGTSWNHPLWLEFLGEVRKTVSANDLSDAEIGQILEAEAAAERQRRIRTTLAAAPTDIVLLEGKAVDALNSGQFLIAGRLFFQLYERGGADRDRHLTHAGFMIWNGVQDCCKTAGSLYTGLRDGSYAKEVFITCLFRLFRSDALDSPVARQIREAVERMISTLEHLIAEDHSTYALPIYAQMLRGSARYDECKLLIQRVLPLPTVSRSVADQLRGCLENIREYDRDSAAACDRARVAFPKMTTVEAGQVQQFHELATRIWRQVRGESAQ